MKKILFIVSAFMLLTASNGAFASCPPHPSNPGLGNGTHAGPSTPPKPKTNPTYSGGNSTHNTETAPIGTATGLMIALGATALGYKIRQNKKENAEKENLDV